MYAYTFKGFMVDARICALYYRFNMISSYLQSGSGLAITITPFVIIYSGLLCVSEKNLS